MPSKCDLPMPGDVHFRYISFQSHKSRFLRVSVSVEMLSETGSRNLLGKDSCRPLHLPVGDAAIARGTAVGSGPDSSQNLSLTSHQQPPLGPRPRPMKHKSQETVPILWGPQGSPQHLLHTPLAVWAQLVTRSTHAWGGGACSVAFTPVKIEYMQAICTLELHAMRFLIVCTLVSI